ncbi:hypothetical protein ABE099_14435, partial [Paenibacillus turicensis]|uniref:hypothetical protein n=1 Tax=Paenibacillus turicensis TaxID=160487 RepID=UPI003D298A72
LLDREHFNLGVGHFFFLSMYVKSVIINAANIMTSVKEKFIRYTSFLEETAPTQGVLYKLNYTIGVCIHAGSFCHAMRECENMGKPKLLTYTGYLSTIKPINDIGNDCR